MQIFEIYRVRLFGGHWAPNLSRPRPCGPTRSGQLVGTPWVRRDHLGAPGRPGRPSLGRPKRPLCRFWGILGRLGLPAAPNTARRCPGPLRRSEHLREGPGARQSRLGGTGCRGYRARVPGHSADFCGVALRSARCSRAAPRWSTRQQEQETAAAPQERRQRAAAKKQKKKGDKKGKGRKKMKQLLKTAANKESA